MYRSKTIVGRTSAATTPNIVCDQYTVINVRDAYDKIFYAIEYLLQNIPN
jgi:hypothetical protein